VVGFFVAALTWATWHYLYGNILASPESLSKFTALVRPTDVFNIWLTVAVVLVGFDQWRAVRWETALEKYYDRREVANRRLEAVILRAAQGESPYTYHDGAGMSIFDTWVYSELDKLEYIMKKYTLGHISPDQVCRSIRTFSVYCRNDNTFRDRARFFVENGAYEKDVKSVVFQIYKEIGP
jgi:hypothetical protein